MAKYKYPVNKNKERILIASNTKDITLQNNPKVVLSDKLDSINNKFNRIATEINNDVINIVNSSAIGETKYKKFTIIKDYNNNSYISKKDNINRYSFNDTDYWIRLNPYVGNRCIVKNSYNNGNHKYNTDGKYSLNEISQMLDNDEYYGYIDNGDWFELETKLWSFKFIININTYRNSNPNTPNKPNNIDLICVECNSRSDKTPGTPWASNTTRIVPELYNNPKIPNGNTPIILSNFTNALWDDFINPLVLRTNNEGFGNVFISHIIDKYKSTVTRNFDKNNIKNSANFNNSGIYDQANLGKVWFLYESEILDQPIFSTVAEGMLCQQYPMFKCSKYRRFRFNNEECCIMTSTLKNGGMNFDPIYINKGFSTQDIPQYMYFPMFGMRFV